VQHLKRAVFGLLAALYAVSVAVQYNDPDPLPWMAIYGCACIVVLLAALKRPMLVPAAVVALCAMVWMITLLPSVPEYISLVRSGEIQMTSFTMKTENGVEEEAREAGGLFLVMVGAFLVAWEARRVASRPDRR
jgi:hypothetical protein